MSTITVVKKIRGTRSTMPAIYVRETVVRINAPSCIKMNLSKGEFIQFGANGGNTIWVRKSKADQSDVFRIKSVVKAESKSPAVTIGSKSVIEAGIPLGIYEYHKTEGAGRNKWYGFKKVSDISYKKKDKKK